MYNFKSCGSAILARLFGIIALCSIIVSCGPSSDKVRIKGAIKGIADAELYLYAESANRTSIDTIRVKDGKFDCLISCGEPEVLNLLFPNFSVLPLIAEGGTTLKVTSDASHLAQTAVTGTDANALFSDLRVRLAPMNPSDQQREAATFVRANADSPAALLALVHYFGRNSSPTAEPLRGLLDVLRKSQGDTPLFVKVSDALSATLCLAIGTQLPHFTSQTLDDQFYDSRNSPSAPMLLYVRAAWAQSNYDIIKTVRHLRQKNPRNYQIVTLNLDTDKESAQRVIANDSLQSCTNLCDVRGITSPLVTTLGISAVPLVILTDAQRRITNVCTDATELRQILNL